ncbi:MAG: DNA-3-methyladenine glycosylase [Steroidobacteraceae bacterium]
MKLATRGPFNLAATVRVLQRRPANRVDVWDGGAYRRVFDLPGGLVLAEVRDGGHRDSPALGCTLHATGGAVDSATRIEVVQRLRRILGLDIDPAPLAERAEREPAMAATARALRGLRPPRFADLFEAFASVVPFQQVSLDAGIAVTGRLVERFGAGFGDAAGQRAFPRAGVIAAARPAALRACGLSAQKARTLQELARLIDRGELRAVDLEALATPVALERLVCLRGVGPWTAGLVLLRGFGRLDMFPPGDVGAQRNLQLLLGTRDARKLAAAITRFGDLRGYLYFCGLGARLLAQGAID